MTTAKLFARVRAPFSVTFGFPIVRKTERSRPKIIKEKGYVEFKGSYVEKEEDFYITLDGEKEIRELVIEALRDNEKEISTFLQRNNIQEYVSIEEVREWISESLVGFFKNNFLLTTLSVKAKESIYDSLRYNNYWFSKIGGLPEAIKAWILNSTFYEHYQTEYFYTGLEEIIDQLESDGIEEGVESIENTIKHLSSIVAKLIKERGTIENESIEVEENDIAEYMDSASGFVIDHISTEYYGYFFGVYDSINKIFLKSIDLDQVTGYDRRSNPESIISFHKDFKEIKLPNGEVGKIRGYAFLAIRKNPEKGGYVPGVVVGIDFPVLSPGGQALSGGGTKHINKQDRVVSSNLFSGVGFLFEVLEPYELEHNELYREDVLPEITTSGKPVLEISDEVLDDECDDCFEEGSVEITQKLHLEFNVGFLSRGLAFFYTRNKVSHYHGYGADKVLEKAWGKTYFIVFQDFGGYENDVKRRYEKLFDLGNSKKSDLLALSAAFPVKPIDLAIRTLLDEPPYYQKQELGAGTSFIEEYELEEMVDGESKKEALRFRVYVIKGDSKYLDEKYWDFSFSKVNSDKEEFIEKSLDYLVLDLLSSPLSEYGELINKIYPLRVPLEREYPYIKALEDELCFKSKEGEKSVVMGTDETTKRKISDLKDIMWERRGMISEKCTIYGKHEDIGFDILGNLYEEVSYRGGRAVVYRVNVEREKE